MERPASHGHRCTECETPDSLTYLAMRRGDVTGYVRCAACGYSGHGNRGEHIQRAHEIKMARIAARIEAAAARIESAMKCGGK